MPFEIRLSTPTRPIADLTAEYAQIPSVDGLMGILPNHAALRCALAPGLMTFRLEDKSEQRYALSTGLAMIENNVVTILADAAERAEEIDVDRAEAAEKRARERIRSMDAKIDRARAESALMRAVARLRLARTFHRAR